MAVIGEMKKLTIGGNTYTIPSGSTVAITRNLTSGTKSATITVDGTAYDIYSTNNSGGTVTSVRVQATSPVQSSTSTAQSSTLNTTISLKDAYGDTKNPYGTKTANYVLAGPSSGSAAAPSFRALVAADIPDLSSIYAPIENIPTITESSTTGITATTTATKITLGTAFTIPNVTSVGSASSWAFEDIACDDITSWSAGSASSWAFTGVTVANSISGAVDSNDSTQLNITLGTTTVQSKSSGSNGSAPSLSYTARTVSSKKSGSNGSAPTLGTAFTVPNITGNTTGSVSVTDNGHTHSI